MSAELRRYDLCDDFISGPAMAESEDGEYVKLGDISDYIRDARDLLIEAEALLCDERGGASANELAKRIREALKERP